MTRILLAIGVSFVLGMSASAAISRMAEAGPQVGSPAAELAAVETTARRHVSVGWFSRRVVAHGLD